MSSRFHSVPSANIKRSQFDLTHGYKTTFDAGLLIPVFVGEALPGDTYSANMTAFARLATPLKPIMDNMFMSSFWFAVPNRLLWENWQRFNGEQDNPTDSTDYLVPTVTGETPIDAETIFDYMGLPIGLVPSVTTVSALPLRAYNLCWNEFFRDENLQDSAPVPKGDEADDQEIYTVRRRS